MTKGSTLDTRNAAQEACLLYQDVYKIIHRLIVDYQHTPHRELGMTPHEKWAEGLQAGFPLVPSCTPEIERLFWRMSPETRVITPKGICAFGLHYWSPELSGAQRVGVDGKLVQYSFHYEPSDISRIALFRGGYWVGDGRAKELRLADGTYQPVSLWERAMAKDLTCDDGRIVCNWTDYLSEIDALKKQRVAEKKAAQRSNKSHSDPASLPNTTTMEKAMQDLSAAPPDQDPTKLLAGFMVTPSTHSPELRSI